MAEKKQGMQRRAVTVLSMAALMVLSGGFMLVPENDLFLKINKSIDVFGRVYKEVATSYVDDIDPEKFMQAGIEGMLGTLDPYTVYIDKENSDEVELLTTGKYGGVGLTIGLRDGAVRVISVMDGYSAQRQGIMPGDRFLEIGGTAVSGMKPEEIRALTRGDPGTEVKVVVEREGETAHLEFLLIREEIQMKNVTYAKLLDDGIGYIRLERFSRKAGDEVRMAVKDMKLNGNLRGLILDLRGNPGGLLDAAVDVVSKFVPRGSTVVSTKGRRPEADKKYLSTEEPVAPAVPMVVLTDRNSASASEIVAGSLQDLDRALIVGNRTFGKGLVQTIVPLSFGAQLKITTARYYIPSGRSIQEIDYMHRDGNGVFTITPDSLRREYKTAHGRKVFELGGIAPDTTVDLEDEGPMVRELHRKSLFFKFTNRYVADHKTDSSGVVTDAMLAAFRQFLVKEKFDYQEDYEKKIGDFRQAAVKSHFGKDVLTELDNLVISLNKEKDRGFDRYGDHLRHELSIELNARLRSERGRIEASLKDDAQVRVAVDLVKDQKLYNRRIGA